MFFLFRCFGGWMIGTVIGGLISGSINGDTASHFMYHFLTGCLLAYGGMSETRYKKIS